MNKKDNKSINKNISKNINKNNLKEIYNKVNHSKYSQIVDISGKVEVKSNMIHFINNYKYLLIAILLIILILLIYTFKTNPIVILYCLIFMIALFLLAMYSATYKIQLDENRLNININFQNTIIDANSLATVYLSKEKMHLFFIPVYNYLLNIVYMKDDTPMIMSFPTVMIDRKSLVKLFTVVKTEKIEKEEGKK